MDNIKDLDVNNRYRCGVGWLQQMRRELVWVCLMLIGAEEEERRGKITVMGAM